LARLSHGSVPAARRRAGNGAHRQLEDRHRQGRGLLGRHPSELPALRDDAVLSCRCLSAATATVQRQG
jgi:hypothetical protein